MSALYLLPSVNRLLGGLTKTFDVLPLDRSIVDILQRLRFRCLDLLLPIIEDLLPLSRRPYQALGGLGGFLGVGGSFGDASQEYSIGDFSERSHHRKVVLVGVLVLCDH